MYTMIKAFVATSILIVVFVSEAVIVASHWVIPAQQEPLKRVVRIGTCGAFWLFTLAGVIPWSFRWYGLAALLSAWALRECLLLYRKREVPQASSPKGVLLQTGAAVLLVFLAVTPALIFPPYVLPEPTGPHTVAAEKYTFTDESRSETFTSAGTPRKVNVEFWYPQPTEGLFPLVIFTHGGLGIGRSNLSLYQELASHGYIVGSIEHPYHAFWTQDVQGKITFVSGEYFRELWREDAENDKQQSYSYYQRWMNTRMSDINFVLDAILNSASVDLFRLVDAGRIGVIGHSLGGSAALGIGRQRSDISAVIALEAPFMYDIVGVKNDRFLFIDQPYPVPVLNIYSDSAWPHLAEWPQYVQNAALIANPPANAFSVHINDVGHLGLTDLTLSSPFLVQFLDGIPADAEHIDTINGLCLEFFNAYLKTRREFN